MMSPPSVSAVIPVHNGGAFVADAIRSTLEQTRPPIECLVIDDGSTDATADVVRAFGGDVTYVCQARAGVAAARNRGAQLARGALLAFLDHDDIWLPEKLERQLDAIEHEQATIALCAVDVIDPSGRLLETKRVHARTDLVTGMVMFDGSETVSCGSAGVFVRRAFMESGGFDSALSMSADWDILLRMLLDGRFAYVDESLVRYRVHGLNMSRETAVMERDMRYALAKAFADPRLPQALRIRERRAYGRMYRMLAGSYRDRGQWLPAFRALARAIVHDPRIARELFGWP